MSRRYIDFISAYCDRWCERCAFTERCSNFAVTAALAMCDGDESAAMELAVGPPRMPGRDAQKPVQERMAEAFGDYEPDQKELDEVGRELDARRERIGKLAVAEASNDYAIAAHRWLREHERDSETADATVRDAIEIIGWDHFLIRVKITRALDGRDECPNGKPFWKNAVQSDWNGSAKVAMISIERSERAWRLVASATGDEAAGVLADALASLRQAMSQDFPRAMQFRRPGFDDRRRGG